ncbi:hypothetical protein BCR44DRAFT_1437770, partial [Catenaria anguillulae PL171]
AWERGQSNTRRIDDTCVYRLWDLGSLASATPSRGFAQFHICLTASMPPTRAIHSHHRFRRFGHVPRQRVPRRFHSPLFAHRVVGHRLRNRPRIHVAPETLHGLVGPNNTIPRIRHEWPQHLGANGRRAD